jgi:hypothetical protein
MMPLLREDDTVEIQSFPYESLNPGHIIAYGVQDIILHRVVSKTRVGLLVAGDSNILLDDCVTKDSYLGLAIARLRNSEPKLDLLSQDGFYTSSGLGTPLETYIPTSIFSTLSEEGKDFCNISLFPLEEFMSQEDDLATIAGISPNGFQNEECLLRKTVNEEIKKLICFGSFGPENSGLIPVNKTLGVFRLGIFDSLQNLYSLKSIELSLTYLDGLLSIRRLTNLEVTR